jgi:hypothetical protein
MNAYLQRADDFIQQQIYKYEQKRQGRDYREMHNQSHQKQQRTSRAQTFNNTPPQGPLAPKGWAQEYDHQSQRWYYIEHSTGRSQWEPPPFSQNQRGHRHTFGDHSQLEVNTSRDEEIARMMHAEEEARARSRAPATWNTSRLQPGHLGVPQQRPLSMSPNSSPHGRLPPGAHFDMKTGQVVTNMFPPDHPMNAH